MQKRIRLKVRQKGAVLILMAFIIGLGVLAYLLNAFDPARLRLEQDKKTMQTLNEAKQALIAWVVSHPTYPGQFPYPDRREVVSPNYDGKSDCPPSNTAFLPSSYELLIGQLPIAGQDLPCVDYLQGLGEDFRDAQGNRLWYAVSRNLVHHYEFLSADPDSNPIINPSIVGSHSYPWLKILDRNGQLISVRVAVVIIAPGNALAGQNRTGIAPTVTQFLDTFQIGSSTFSNTNYDSADEDFVIGQDSRDVSELDTSVVKPYYFNDKLVFITIDELMSALNNRANVEASNLLNKYRNKNTQFPYAAALGAALNNHISSGISTKGMLPIDVTDNCSCADEFTCSCSFNPIASVALERGGGTWNTALDTGSCSSAIGAPSDTCTCTGAGSCSRFATTFICTAAGVCAHNLPAGANKFVYSVPTYADIYATTADCTISGNQAECDNTGTFSIGLKEPVWFKQNLWQDYIYYEWSAMSNLQFGAKANLTAILINAGQVNAGQDRSFPLISNYLDTAENTDGDNIFEASNKQKTGVYNDQAFVVAP